MVRVDCKTKHIFSVNYIVYLYKQRKNKKKKCYSDYTRKKPIEPRANINNMRELHKY